MPWRPADIAHVPRRLLPFLSGLLFLAIFPPVDFGWLAYAAPAPYLVFLMEEKRARFRFSLLAGFLAYAVGFAWLRHISWAAVGGIAALHALYWALAGEAIRVQVVRLRVPLPIAAAAGWTAMEYVRASLFTGFPWFFLGHGFHAFAWPRQAADVAGVYGLTFCAAAVAGALAEAWLVRRSPRDGAASDRAEGRTRRFAFAGAIVLLGAAPWMYGALRLPTVRCEEGPTVAVVQANISQDLKNLKRNYEFIHQKHLDLSKAIDPKPDLLIWGESMFPFYQGLREDYDERLRLLPGLVGTRCLVGVLTVDAVEVDGRMKVKDVFNSAAFLSPDGAILWKYDKVHLVPFGEYSPTGEEIPIVGSIIQYFSGLTFTPDVSPGVRGEPLRFEGRAYGALVCFEIIFPESVRGWARDGTSCIVNLSNEGWFRDGAELDQMIVASKFRAVESRVGIIRATNTGISALIRADGEPAAVLEKDGDRREVEGVLTGRAPLGSGDSLYVTWGDRPVQALTWAWLAAWGAGAALGWRARRREGTALNG